MPSILTKLDLLQNRIATLQDILQDTLYLAKYEGLPACTIHDLQRSIDDTESISANLAAIWTRLRRTHPHLEL